MRLPSRAERSAGAQTRRNSAPKWEEETRFQPTLAKCSLCLQTKWRALFPIPLPALPPVQPLASPPYLASRAPRSLPGPSRTASTAENTIVKGDGRGGEYLVNSSARARPLESRGGSSKSHVTRQALRLRRPWKGGVTIVYSRSTWLGGVTRSMRQRIEVPAPLACKYTHTYSVAAQLFSLERTI